MKIESSNPIELHIKGLQSEPLKIKVDAVESEELKVNVKTVPLNPVQVIGETTFSAYHSKIWAEGSDEEVSKLGGEHSSKGWAGKAEEIAEQIEGDISDLRADVEQVKIDIAQEAINREQADTELGNTITALDTKVDGINANLTQQITELESDVDGKYEELTRDIDDLADVVEEDFTKVNNRITEVASELEQTIEENVVALQNEDNALQNQINAHSQTLTAYDTRIANNASAISQEIYDRQSADDALQETIDQTKQDKLTEAQLAAVNSGIDSNKVAVYDGYANTLATKANDNSVVHIAGNETITGVKTFNGGKISAGGQPSIAASNGVMVGSYTATGWADVSCHRLCDNKINTGSYYVNSDGSVIFRHKTGTATAEGNANDAIFTFHPVNGIKAGFGGAAGVTAVANDVLIDTVNYSKLDTTNKDVLGSINELNSTKQENLDIILLEGATINA